MKHIFFRRMQSSASRNPFQWIFGILMMIAFFMFVFWLFRGIYSLLSFVAPVLLIITAFINYRVITGYLSTLWATFQKNWLLGILAAILTVVGFPLVSGFLFFQALTRNKISSLQEEAENKRMGEFVDYEDVSDEPSEELILKRPEEIKRPEENRYDHMF